MAIISFLTGCFKPHQEYQSLNKKDDDLGIEPTKRWINSHPIDNQLQLWTNGRINAYAIDLIKELQKNVLATSANIQTIINPLFK